MQARYRSNKHMRDSRRIARVLTIVTLLLPLTVLTVKAENLSYTHTPIIIGVHPPQQAYPGENITIGVIVQALEDLRDIDLYIYAHGSKNEGYDSWSTYLSIMNDTNLTRGSVRDGNYSLSIPSNASAGLVYAIAHIHYRYWSDGWHEYGTDIVFQMTYLKNKAYEDLQSDYISLLNEYNNYRQEHGYTDSGYSGVSGIYDVLGSVSNYLQALIFRGWRVDLGLSGDLTRVLVTTMVILFISASFLALRKSKEREKACETSQRGLWTSIYRMASRVSRLLRKGDVHTKTSSSTSREGKEEKTLIRQAQEILNYR